MEGERTVSDLKTQDDVSAASDPGLPEAINRKKRKHGYRWYRTPSNVISAFAVLVTLFIFVTTLILGTRAERARKQFDVGQLIEQISALAGEEAEVYSSASPPIARTNAMMAIANRRNVLISQAEGLLADVEDLLPKLDLALLATVYASAGTL